MSLSADQLAFIVQFIGACRRAEDDGALGDLIEALRTTVDLPALWAGSCNPDGVAAAGVSGSVAAAALRDCRPDRHATPERTAHATRACLDAGTGRSACLLLEGEHPDEVRELLAHVAPHLLEAVARVNHRPAPDAVALTPREEEILRWLVQGKSNEVIGTILGVTPRTVKFHLTNLYAKLGVSTRAQAAAVAVSRLA